MNNTWAVRNGEQMRVPTLGEQTRTVFVHFPTNCGNACFVTKGCVIMSMENVT